MSQRALLLAVRDYLRNNVPLALAECQVQFSAAPPPNCGERFVAVHQGYWRGIEPLEGLQEEYGISVTVTMRAAKVPKDELGANLLVGPTGKSLDELLERIRALLHKDKGPYPVLALANTTIGAGANGFVEPLVFRDGGQCQEKGPSWFSASANQATGAAVCGLAQTLTFGGAKRYQTVESET